MIKKIGKLIVSTFFIVQSINQLSAAENRWNVNIKSELNLNLDVSEGYNPTKNKQALIGYITKLSIAGKELEPDQHVQLPLEIERDFFCVGVLNYIFLDKRGEERLEFSAFISPRNGGLVKSLLFTPLANPDVNLQFICYAVDAEGHYFPFFYSLNTDLKTVLQCKRNEWSLMVDDSASTKAIPQSFELMMAVLPKGSQKLEFKSLPISTQ